MTDDDIQEQWGVYRVRSSDGALVCLGVFLSEREARKAFKGEYLMPDDNLVFKKLPLPRDDWFLSMVRKQNEKKDGNR